MAILLTHLPPIATRALRDKLPRMNNHLYCINSSFIYLMQLFFIVNIGRCTSRWVTSFPPALGHPSCQPSFCSMSDIIAVWAHSNACELFGIASKDQSANCPYVVPATSNRNHMRKSHVQRLNRADFKSATVLHLLKKLLFLPHPISPQWLAL